MSDQSKKGGREPTKEQREAAGRVAKQLHQSIFEKRVREKAKRKGYRVTKSRQKSTNANNWGDYMLVDANHNTVIMGQNYDAALEDIASFLEDAPRTF